MARRLKDLTEGLDVELRGDPEVRISGVGTLHNATAGQLSFLANPKYRRHLAATKASAVVVSREDAEAAPCSAVMADDPYATYARMVARLCPAPTVEPGVHPAAVVESGAEVDSGACIGANAFVGRGARIEAGAHVGPNCVVEAGAVVGADTSLVASVTICRNVTVGRRCLFHPGVVVGADGFGLAREPDRWIKVPQVGSVRIEDDVELGANTTVDRGALEDTIIEQGVKLDNQIQVAHNVRIGAHTVIAGCTAIAGSVTIGRNCRIAGGVGIAGHLDIADGVVVMAMTLVTHSLREPGVYSGSLPVDEVRSWRRNSARYRQLDKLARRLARLEDEFGKH